jgi:hypothetical protein
MGLATLQQSIFLMLVDDLVPSTGHLLSLLHRLLTDVPFSTSFRTIPCNVTDFHLNMCHMLQVKILVEYLSRSF